jgi:hypothetical protein
MAAIACVEAQDKDEDKNVIKVDSNGLEEE